MRGRLLRPAEAQPNVLTFRIQPEEGISLTFSAKRPGMQLDLHPVDCRFRLRQVVPRRLPEAYERLIFDALRGDATLFMRADELEAAWGFVTPILEAWANRGPPAWPVTPPARGDRPKRTNSSRRLPGRMAASLNRIASEPRWRPEMSRGCWFPQRRRPVGPASRNYHLCSSVPAPGTGRQHQA